MFALVIAAASILPAGPVDLRGGEKHEYTLTLRKGEFVRLVVEQIGIDVVVVALDPAGAKLQEIDSPNGANGPEPVPLAARRSGTHRIEIRSFDAQAPPGKYSLRIEERLTPGAYQRRLAEERARDAAVIAWMRARLVPLRAVEPGSGFDDLRALEPILADVRVVGLGEATHGSHEIFALKHRLIEFLVTRMGFTMLAIEGSVVEVARMNDYIAGQAGRTTALDLLRSGGWITATEELAALLDWVRAFNATAPEDRRVRMVGLDPQDVGGAIDFLSDYLVRAGRTDFKSLLDEVRTQDANALQFARTEISLDTLRDLYRLLAFLVLNEGELSARTSAGEHGRAVEYARLLAQFGEFNASLPPGRAGTRDGYMADHLFRALQSAPAGTRVIVWAHNSHVAARQTGSFPPMGGNLRRVFGSGYYALATAFDRGSFQAQKAGTTPPDLREYSVPAATEGTLDWFLRQATATTAFLDLRRDPPTDPRIADWLRADRRMHWVGAIFSEQSIPFQTFVPSRDFDGVVFIPSTTRARPLER